MGLDGKYRPLVGALSALLALAATCVAATAQDCRLALALALDVSSSVDEQEYLLQKNGLAGALISQPVRSALLEDAGGSVALAIYEWSGRNQQSVVVDWTILRSDADITAVASHLTGGTRSHSDFPTAMGYALGYGAGLLRDGPNCLHQTLDMSGDGVSNEGFEPALAYANFPLSGVTVNGLVVAGSDPGVLPYYQREVIRGPGAFVEIAGGYQDYQRAMQQKLLREVSVRVFAMAGRRR